MRRTTIGMLVGLLAIGALSLEPAPAAAAAAEVGNHIWLRPVAGRIVRAFAAPVTRYGAGHLGVDFAAAPGTAVHAAGAGTVVFAGLVAGARHVVVSHAGGRRTSYSFLASIRVHTGESVARGAVVGTAGGHGANHGSGVLHFGLRIGDTYVDPMRLFPARGLPARVHLAPAEASPSRSVGRTAERKALVAGIAGPPTAVVLRAAEPAHGPGARMVSICVRLVAAHRPGLAEAPFRPG